MTQQAKNRWEITISSLSENMLRYLRTEIDQELEYRDYQKKDYPELLNFLDGGL